MCKRQELRIVRRVTRKHGAIFAEALERHAFGHGSAFEAFAETGLMEWPDGYLNDHAKQDAYVDLETEILRTMFDRVRDVIATTFVAAAREVLDRERERRRAERASS